MSLLVKNIIRFILFILMQVYVLSQIPPLHQFITPYLYFLFILWLPFTISRFGLLLVSFLLGITLDYFLSTPGLHAAPCVLIAYLRPFLINILISQEGAELNYAEPSIKSMGFAPYSLYVLVFTFIHHFYLVLIEWLQFGNFLYFLGKVTATTGVSLLLIFVTEMLFFRKQKFRTNTA
ncbi:rod shape-determining protein MreD [Segetibacter aerophilus]|uniref:Rod shape-determining protein MreD n=1 Tax=Segetibacter aerophilus TaxID=670293 RepID=A0A512BD98_9BACT|nr:rod shape-determining protein MreD [Segetibacter aerophilus]GEO09837.1 rod shape-determining protein MreD [Segetibacter aerophilus]